MIAKVRSTQFESILEPFFLHLRLVLSQRFSHFSISSGLRHRPTDTSAALRSSRRLVSSSGQFCASFEAWHLSKERVCLLELIRGGRRRGLASTQVPHSVRRRTIAYVKILGFFVRCRIVNLKGTHLYFCRLRNHIGGALYRFEPSGDPIAHLLYHRASQRLTFLMRWW